MADVNEKEKNKQSDALKSTAVVKYAGQDVPARFQRLHPNTNLNNPPSNWLYGKSRWESYIRQSASQGRPSNDIFGSIKMAHSFPDLTGDIDVISDNENIKRLLKVPYSSESLSLMVHRVGNTLLLDNFDVHTQLLRRQQDDWGKWLRQFYYDTVSRKMAPEKSVIKKNKSRSYLQERNLTSKFYTMSCADDDPQTSSPPSPPVPLPASPSSTPPRWGSSTAQTMLLPDPLPAASPRDTSQHQRTVVWNFEDLRMLVGTDLAIFGGVDYPAISLHLRDGLRPISVLTGMDYWLDNLMCNVPELAMCYHLNGIVQNYELIKTEDIPNLEHSKFKPQVVKDIAQNILSFLKTNATAEGHTYWLFKGQNDDVVKLYDLTSVCEEYMEDNTNNPFSVPVGILLYRVARNMYQTHGRKKSAIIRRLLENSLKLLDEDRHSQVVTSAHFLLSNIYISDDLNDSSEDIEDETDDDTSSEISEHAPSEQTEEEEGAEGDSIKAESSVAVPSLSLSASSQNHTTPSPNRLDVVRYPPITGSPKDKCLQAMQHIVQALQCLDSSAVMYDSSKHKVDEQGKWNPNEAIPLHYQPLNTPNKGSATTQHTEEAKHHVGNGDNQVQPLSSSSSLPAGSWHGLSKSLLMKKASGTSFHLANLAVEQNQPTQALLHTKLALVCHAAMLVLSSPNADQASTSGSNPLSTPSIETKLLCGILSAVADAHIHLAKQDKPPKHLPELSEEQQAVMESALKELPAKKKNEVEFEFSSFCTLPNPPSALRHFELSVQAYQHAIQRFEADTCRASRHNTNRRTSTKGSSLGTKGLSSGTKASNCGTKGSSTGTKGLNPGAKCSEATLRSTDGATVAYLSKRLGNAQNEYGVALMNAANTAASRYTDSSGEGPMTEIESLLQRSEEALEVAQECWDELEDKINQAFVQNNLARLFRLKAKTFRQMHCPGNTQLTQPERHYNIKAAEHYQRALQCVLDGGGRDGDSLHASISWDLSSTYYNIATLLQDYAPLATTSQEQIEKEVTELMTKALKYCKPDDNTSRQYRAATIHHRLASLYHNSYRNQAVEQKKKQLRSLAELHYGRAHSLFVCVDCPCEMIRMQLERVAMCEYQMQVQLSGSSRLRSLQQALEHLFACIAPFSTFLSSMDDMETVLNYEEEANKLLTLVQSRLQATLHGMVKNSTAVKKSDARHVKIYKEMYGRALKAFQKQSPLLKHNCQNMLSLLEELKRDYQTITATAEKL